MGVKVYLVALYVVLWSVAITAPSSDAAGLLPELLGFKGPDAWSIVVFNLMGVWPVLAGAPLLADGPGQRVPSWPFVLLSFAAGAFVLIPYLLIRRWKQPPRHRPGWRRWSRPVAAFAGATIVGMLGWGAFTGSLPEFSARVASDGFVRTYTADFVAFALLYPPVALDDRRRIGLAGPSWAVFVPLIGGVLHLWQRGGLRTVH